MFPIHNFTRLFRLFRLSTHKLLIHKRIPNNLFLVFDKLQKPRLPIDYCDIAPVVACLNPPAYGLYYICKVKKRGRLSPPLSLLLDYPDLVFRDSVCYQFLDKLDCIPVSLEPAEENRIILLPLYTGLITLLDADFPFAFRRYDCDFHCFRS